jgi:hypothetical protein
MTVNLVPEHICMKHENEWLALRDVLESRIDIRKPETPSWNPASDSTNASGQNNSNAQPT